MCKLSVIVPVYNEEKTIGRCLDSLLLQELQDMEILVVNDGSTDESGKVVRAYMEKDPRVRMIEQENRGLGAARNSGIRAAKGNYIGFVDSDDFVDLAMYRVMVEALENTNAQVAVCQEKNVYMENGTCHFINETKFPVKGVTVVSNIEVLKWQMNYTYMILNSAGNKVYEKKVLEEHTLYFPEAHRYAEDIPFSIGLFSVAEKVAIVPQSLYYYVRTKGSISRSYTLKHAEDVYLDWKEALQAIRRNGVKINTDNFSLGMYFASMKQLTWSADKQEKTSAQAKKLRARWEKARKKQRWKPDFASAQVPFLHKLKIVLAYCHLQGLMFAGARLLRWIPFFKFMV